MQSSSASTSSASSSSATSTSSSTTGSSSAVPPSATSGPAFKRLAKEYQTFQSSPPPQVLAASLPTSNLSQWHITIAGPSSTPYNGGRFTLSFTFPPSYPMRPPNVSFVTAIYHVNVDMKGGGVICQDIVSGGWSPTLRVSDVVARVVRMMEVPVVETPLDAEIGEMCSSRPDKYREIAQQWTKKHAMG